MCGHHKLRPDESLHCHSLVFILPYTKCSALINGLSFFNFLLLVVYVILGFFTLSFLDRTVHRFLFCCFFSVLCSFFIVFDSSWRKRQSRQINVATIANPDRLIKLLSGDWHCLLRALRAKEKTTRSAVMFPSPKPKLSVTAHALTSGVVRDPKSRTSFSFLNCFPAHLAAAPPVAVPASTN